MSRHSLSWALASAVTLVLWHASALGAGPATLVKDLTTAPVNLRLNDTSGFTPLGSQLYFVASVAETGEELWRTDGTAEGTSLVKDIVPGPAGSSPRLLTAWKGKLYFVGFLPRGGIVLYVSDGTAAGTLPQVVLHPDGDIVQPSLSNLAPLENRLCIGLNYYAGDGTRDTLLCTDGTEQGTVRIPGSWSSAEQGDAPDSLWPVGGMAYFQLNTSQGRELWRTDGTPEGTRLFKELVPQAAGAAPSSLVLFQGKLYFRAASPQGDSSLWRTDGTASGTVLVKGLAGASGCVCDLRVASGLLWIPASSPDTGLELWKSDGTAEGTVFVKDLLPGATGSNPFGFSEVQGATVFWALSPQGRQGLWRTDGTEAGTVFLQEDSFSAPHSFNGVTYFSAAAPGLGEELWRTDGTAEGTHLLKDLSVGAGDSSPQGFVSWNGTLFFRAVDADGYASPWRSDGTPEGTRPLVDVPGPTAGAFPRVLTPAGARLYFHARDTLLSAALWTSDGTAQGTVPLHSMPLTPPAPGWLATLDGRALFRATSAEAGAELWLSDGTLAGTQLLKDLSPGPASSTPDLLTPLAGTVYFRAGAPDSGSELWRSDGTPDGTHLVTDLVPGTGSSAPAYLTPMGGVLYFSASTPDTGVELWRTDGTPEGTRLVKDFVAGTGSSNPILLAAAGTTLYVQVGRQLWKSDGTPEGTVFLKEIGLGSITEPTAVGGSLYFRILLSTRPSPTEWVQLWKSDGTPEGTGPLLSTLDVEQLTPMKGSLYFFAEDATAGYALWRTDGTSVGTVKVKPLMRGWWGASRTPAKMLALEPEGRLIFSAADAAGSLEPWMSDGTAEGTVRIEDLAPGLLPSNPSGFARVGERVYFSANEGSLGQELYSLPISELYDRTPPELTCPAPVAVESADGQARTVEYPAATARDAYTASPAITYSQPSGGTFVVGDTSVTVTATDERGNSATCSFTVTVKPPSSPGATEPGPTEPTGGCGCGASGVGAPWLALGLGAWLVRRRRSAALRS